jgi:hypothetical protein
VKGEIENSLKLAFLNLRYAITTTTTTNSTSTAKLGCCQNSSDVQSHEYSRQGICNVVLFFFFCFFFLCSKSNASVSGIDLYFRWESLLRCW